MHYTSLFWNSWNSVTRCAPFYIYLYYIFRKTTRLLYSFKPPFHGLFTVLYLIFLIIHCNTQFCLWKRKIEENLMTIAQKSRECVTFCFFYFITQINVAAHLIFTVFFQLTVVPSFFLTLFSNYTVLCGDEPYCTCVCRPAAPVQVALEAWARYIPKRLTV